MTHSLARQNTWRHFLSQISFCSVVFCLDFKTRQNTTEHDRTGNRIFLHKKIINVQLKQQWSQAIINDSNKSQDPFHAQNKLSFSSSWLSKVSSFRQETYRIYYRNNPVKYNLTPLLNCSNLRNIWFAYHTVIWLNHTISYTMAVSSFWARSEKGQTVRKGQKLVR